MEARIRQKKSNFEERSAQCKRGQEISGSVYTNKEKEKLVEQVGEPVISVAHLVNVVCRSNFVQVALTNLLVAMEPSSGAKSNKGMGHKGSAKEAHSERGVHFFGKEVGPSNDMCGQIAIMSGPIRIEPAGIGESVLSSSAIFGGVDDEGRPKRESNVETTSAEHECVKRNYTIGGEGVNGHSSSISEKGDKRQSQSNSDECCSRVDSEPAEIGGEEDGINTVKNPRCRRRKRLWELGEPSTLPQGKVQIGAGSLYIGSGTESRVSTNSNSLSDGDIAKCISRFRSVGKGEDQRVVWEAGKQIGVVCHKIEHDVIKELERMEARDTEVMKKY